ncbi:unnamed protein product, partial [Ilex paraguariensis]
RHEHLTSPNKDTLKGVTPTKGRNETDPVWKATCDIDYHSTLKKGILRVPLSLSRIRESKKIMYKGPLSVS